MVRVFQYPVLALFLILACISVLQGFILATANPDSSQDYQWGPARALLQHRNPYQMFLKADTKPAFMLSQAPNYPATGLMVLWPYAACEWETAKLLWALSNLVFTAIILICTLRLLPAEVGLYGRTLLVLAFLMSTPWRNTMGNGQHGLFVFAAFLLAVTVSRRKLMQGGLLALSWLKYSLSFPLTLYFLLQRQGWNRIILAGLIQVAGFLFLAGWTHTSPLELLTGPLQVAQSGICRGYLDVYSLATELGIESRLIPALLGLGIGWMSFRACRRETDTLSILSILALTSLLIVFHAWYDFIVLLLPLAWALRAHGQGLRAQMYLITVGLVWFADRLMYITENLPEMADEDFSIRVLFLSRAALVYGCLFLDLHLILRSRKPPRVPRNAAAYRMTSGSEVVHK